MKRRNCFSKRRSLFGRMGFAYSLIWGIFSSTFRGSDVVVKTSNRFQELSVGEDGEDDGGGNNNDDDNDDNG